MSNLNKERTVFLNDLAEFFVKNAEDDEEYFNKLIWANTYISKELSKYENIYEKLGW